MTEPNARKLIGRPPKPPPPVGARFGRLVIASETFPGKGYTKMVWCKCDCGTEKILDMRNVRKGHTRSCGCINKPRKDARERRCAWNIRCAMLKRCYEPTNPNYSRYGGRGITVCEAWRASFEQFWSDMWPRPSRRYSIDRIDNDGPYTPANCRWATSHQQQSNKSTNYRVEVNGVPMILADASRTLGLSVGRIKTMVRRGLLRRLQVAS